VLDVKFHFYSRPFYAKKDYLDVVELLREMKHTSHSQWEVACFETCLKTENELPSLLSA
jgi:hypothetical protein